ncbi:MAG: hypothetical protein Q4E64_10200 [Phascolarctobacterium sp.]|uniref:hypothetical protein n=1 Tax=Phascolarctobacterium sp. TaxID=2049039 RepID=UPI0026DD357D|nr:hypothetical protein [Phascolarctobacterium sp.]MDO4922178.1 hypothetical protein [Phascolarctobacterium sp.]
MRAAALLACLTLSMCSAAAAATPDEVWQDYQKRPDYVSTQPRQPAPAPTPHITVEDNTGHISEPTTPQQAKEKAVATAPAERARSRTGKAKKHLAEQNADAAAVAENQTPKQPAPAVGTAPQAAAPKPKPLPSLVKKPPLPKQFLRTPQPGDFVTANSAAGSYSLLLPQAFGSDPLEQLPSAQGAMLVRAASNTLMCAATVLDPTDTVSYDAQQPLPAYANKKLYCRWQHGTALVWDCALSRHEDFYGDKLLLEASAKQNGKTYQLLYVMPAEQTRVYLPQALYSLDSFAVNENK